VRFQYFDGYHRIKSHPFEEHMRYWLPGIHRILTRFFIRRRISIFRSLDSSVNAYARIFWLITGSHFSSKDFSLSNYGVWLASRPNDITYKLCLDASYQNDLDKILHNISKDTIFIDIGANIGVFSLVAEQNPNVVAIHSFEPDGESFKYLEKNIVRNNSNRIYAHNFAISVNPGEARLTKHDGHSGISSIVNEQTELTGPYSLITIVNHEYLNSIFSPLKGEYFVKIDVEGHEYEVLETLKATDFFPDIKAFFIEFDRKQSEKTEQVENFLIKNLFIESGRWGSSRGDTLWEKQDQ